jgi:hypothetical protein
MCCFSRAVQKVANTNIFARASKDDKQFLVYSMLLAAKEELAMILPIPTPKASKEDAVRFISLKEYPDFFKDMQKGFPAPRSLGGSRNSKGPPPPGPRPKLVVVEVGSYVASFVPTIADFDRLDERFRLPKETWDHLPAYKEYGFAVFKLKPGEKEIHPMAFEFPRADKKRLFFPTVHIHDGKIHKTAAFDHHLYCQVKGEEIGAWSESPGHAASFMQIAKCAGLVEKDAHVYRVMLKGRKTNQDTWLA